MPPRFFKPLVIEVDRSREEAEERRQRKLLAEEVGRFRSWAGDRVRRKVRQGLKLIREQNPEAFRPRREGVFDELLTPRGLDEGFGAVEAQAAGFRGIGPEEARRNVGRERARSLLETLDSDQRSQAARLSVDVRQGRMSREDFVERVNRLARGERVEEQEQPIQRLRPYQRELIGLFQQGRLDEQDFASLSAAQPSQNAVRAILDAEVPDELKEIVFDWFREAQNRRRERAPVGDPLGLAAEFAGVGASEAAGALGAPEGLQRGLRMGVPLAAEVASAAVPVARLPRAVRPLAGAFELGQPQTATRGAGVIDAPPPRRPPFALGGAGERLERGVTGAVPEGAESFVPRMRPLRKQVVPRMRPLRKPVREALEQGNAIAEADRVAVAQKLRRFDYPPASKIGRPLNVQQRRELALMKLDRMDARAFQPIEQTIEGFGDRFKRNLFTRIDDITAPLRGADRELEKAVRDSVVEADIYRATEGAVANVELDAWIGDWRQVFDMDITPEGTFLRGVQVREGAEIPELARQRLTDVVQYPEDYILTPDQATGIRVMFGEDGVLDEMLRLNQAKGIDIEEILERPYAPQIVIEDTQQVVTGGAARPESLAARPWFAKPREFPTMRDGIKAGKTYAPDLDALRLRLVGGIDAMANRHVTDTIKGMGTKPSTLVKPRFREEAAEAASQWREARERFIRTGALADREAADAARIRLEEAKTALRHQADIAAQEAPKVFGRVVAPEALQEFSRYVRDIDPDAMDEMFQMARGIMVSVDYASPGIQNWMLFWRNNPAWLKSYGLGAMAFKDAPYEYVARNIDDIVPLARSGMLAPPADFQLSRGGSLSRKLGQAPLFKQAQRAFEWNIFVGTVEHGKGVLRNVENMDELLDMAAVLRKQHGGIIVPGMTRSKAKLLPKLFFAWRFYAGIHGALLDPIIARGPARIEALKATAAAFGGAATATIGANMLLNGKMPNIDDPDAQGYWQVDIPGVGFISLFGPYTPLIRALGKAAKEPERAHFAMAQYLEGKGALEIRWLIRATEAMGAPVSEIRGREPFFSPTQTFSQGLTGTIRDWLPLPIGPADVAITAAERGITSAETGLSLLEPITGMVRFTPESNFTRFRQAQDEVAQELYGSTYEDLNEIEQARVNQDTRVEQAREELEKGPPRNERQEAFARQRDLRGTQEEEQRADNDDLKNFFTSGGTQGLSPKAWDSRHGEREQTYFARREEVMAQADIQFEDDPDADRISRAIRDYFDVELENYYDGIEDTYDWESYNAAQDRALAPLSSRQRRDFEEFVLGKHDTTLEREFRQLRSQLDAYYDEEIGKDRQDYRERNPNVDAILYITGSTSKLRTAQAVAEANKLVRRIFGAGARIPEGTQVEEPGRRPRLPGTRGPARGPSGSRPEAPTRSNGVTEQNLGERILEAIR